MTHNFDAAGREFLDAGLRSFASLSEGVQSLALEAAEYSWRSIEEGSAAAEELAAAKSPEAVVQAQGLYARRAYEEFVAQASRMNALWADTAKNTLKPLESVVARAR